MFYKFKWDTNYIEERKGDTFLKKDVKIPYTSLEEVDADEFYGGSTKKELGAICVSDGEGSFISLPFISIKDNESGYISISEFKEKLVNKHILNGKEMYIMDECTILKQRGLWDFGDCGDPLE